MSIPEQTAEPAQITAGDSLRWTRSFSDFQADSGWQLNYYLLNSAGKITIAWGAGISADGDAFDVSVPAATTAAWAAGSYRMTGFVSNGTDRVQVYDRDVEILGNPATAATLDSRTHAQRVLDAIEAMIEGTASREEESVMVNFGGTVRTLSFFSREDLLRLYSYYRQLRAQELAQEDAAAGRGNRSVRRYRFTKPS